MSGPLGGYYNVPNFLNNTYAVDMAVITHFANMLFGNDANRIEYSSTDYALRQRSSKYSGNLELPFLNLRRNVFGTSDRKNSLWWNARAYTGGTYIKQLGKKVTYSPIEMEYDATFWVHHEYDLRYAHSQILNDSNNKTTLEATVEINGVQLPFACQLSYSGPQFEPTYNEQDWLERNKIHTISLDFTIDTFLLDTKDEGVDFTIPETACLEFIQLFGVDDAEVKDVYQFVIDHVTETVYEES